MEPIQLPQTSLAPRSNHRPSDFPRGRHAVTADVGFRPHHEQHHEAALDPLAARVQPLEISSFSEPKGSWKNQVPFRRQSACDPCDGGCSKSCGRSWCASEPGNHGSSCACDYSAERFFSWSSLSRKLRARNDIAGLEACQVKVDPLCASLREWTIGSTCYHTSVR